MVLSQSQAIFTQWLGRATHSEVLEDIKQPGEASL
jgi:hypothetical protein